MNWVDVGVLVGVLIVGIAGWRAGLISTAAGFAGFLGGALLGARLIPQLTAGTQWSSLVRAGVTLAGMFVLGLVGQAVLGAVGRRLRDALHFGPIRFLDRAAGLVVSTVAFLLSAWLLLSVAAELPVGPAADEVQSSQAYPLLDRVMAGPAEQIIDEARSLLAGFDLPSLPYNPTTLPPVADPGDVQLTDAVVRTARASVLRVSATSRVCATSSVGSSVVIGRHRVVTNAHVVAGAGRITVAASNGRALGAKLVHLDPAADLAVLYVRDLDAPAPDWVQQPERGMEAAVVGYPGGGRLTMRGARVRGLASIPPESGVGLRDVVVLQGIVQPGNSGGPLLDLDGDVIGLIFANSSVDDRTGFALSPSEVVPVIEQTRRATEPVDSGACPAR